MLVNEMKCEAPCFLESCMCVNGHSRAILKEPRAMRRVTIKGLDDCPRLLETSQAPAEPWSRKLFNCRWENQHRSSTIQCHNHTLSNNLALSLKENGISVGICLFSNHYLATAQQ